MSGNPIKDRIDAQFQVAREKFPQLHEVQSDSKTYDYRIVFPDSPKFQYLIQFPLTYPNAPPILSENNVKFKLPMTSNWMNVFQFLHVVQQIRLRNQNMPSTRIIPNEESIRNSISSFKNKIEDEDQRRQLIQTIPQVKEANDQMEKEINKSKAKSDEAASIFGQSLDSAEKVRQLKEESIRISHEINAAQSSGPDKLYEAKKIKASEYRKKAFDKDPEIEALKKRVQEGQDNRKQYVEELKKLYQEKIYYNTLADSIEKSTF